MHSASVLIVGFWVLLAVIEGGQVDGLTIDCQPNGLLQPSQTVRKICDTLAMFIDSGAIQAESELDRRQMGTRKRQDVDHVFLRFGRRFDNY